MENDAAIPNLAGYRSVKEAAKFLGISDTRVYYYIEKGRLHPVWAGSNMMIPEEEITQLKQRPMPAGRPRKTTPLWRISSGNNIQYITEITFQMEPEKYPLLEKSLEEIRETKAHLFPGTVARYIVGNDANPEQIRLILVWRGTVLPDEATRQKELAALQETLDSILDWDTAQYQYGQVFMHT